MTNLALAMPASILTLPKKGTRICPQRVRIVSCMLRRLMDCRNEEVLKVELGKVPGPKAMINDNGRELECPKHTSKIAKPIHSPATFVCKVFALPPSSFVPLSSRTPAHIHTSHACTVGPTCMRNRFTAIYEDDELDGADDLTAMPKELSMEKESINASQPKFEPPSRFSFTPMHLSCLFSIVNI